MGGGDKRSDKRRALLNQAVAVLGAASLDVLAFFAGFLWIPHSVLADPSALTRPGGRAGGNRQVNIRSECADADHIDLATTAQEHKSK